jgi:hypothetical protein
MILIDYVFIDRREQGGIDWGNSSEGKPIENATLLPRFIRSVKADYSLFFVQPH